MLRAYASWAETAPYAATTCVRLLHPPPLPELPEPLRGNSFVVIDGAVDAPGEEAVALLAALRALGPVMDTFAEIPTTGLGIVHMDPPGQVPGVGDGMIIDELTDAAIVVPRSRTVTKALRVRFVALLAAFIGDRRARCAQRPTRR